MEDDEDDFGAGQARLVELVDVSPDYLKFDMRLVQNLEAASMEAAHDYVPPGSKEVLAHTKLLGPGETDTVTFTAPFVPGRYLYLCSFPGHYSQGTKGFMTVK